MLGIETNPLKIKICCSEIYSNLIILTWGSVIGFLFDSDPEVLVPKPVIYSVDEVTFLCTEKLYHVSCFYASMYGKVGDVMK